jgi:hypothetical protein
LRGVQGLRVDRVDRSPQNPTAANENVSMKARRFSATRTRSVSVTLKDEQPRNAYRKSPVLLRFVSKIQGDFNAISTVFSLPKIEKSP